MRALLRCVRVRSAPVLLHAPTSAIARPPVNRSRLVSRAFVYARLREATGASKVLSAAVDAAIARLEDDFARLLADVVERVDRERELRRVHGLYASPAVEARHVEQGDTTRPKSPARVSGHGIDSCPGR